MGKTDNSHLKHISILIAVALVLGIYLAASTVIISKDGVTYIERAQKLSTDLHAVMNLNEPFGLPVLIAAFHKLPGLGNTSQSWILAGQICVLTCRLLTIAVLYFFGTVLFKPKDSFWAVLILIVLPWPAKYGADILREWPHLLFLFTGLLLLYQGLRKSSTVRLFAAGIVSGLGYMIRPECAQVVLYGLVFFVVKVVSDIRHQRPFLKNRIYLGLLFGFLVVFLPYTLQLNKKIPDKLEHLFFNKSQPVSSDPATAPIETAGILNADGPFQATVNLLTGVIEDLMYYFALPAAVGFYVLFMKSPRPFGDRRLLIGFFLGFYVVALMLLDLRWGYISRRHTLPAAVMLSFYIPAGTRQIACWMDRKAIDNPIRAQKWSLILIVLGILICLPKLLKPTGSDKRYYRRAADWISQHTTPEDRFYTFDKRIPFYAGRSCRLYHPERYKAGFRENYLIAQSTHGQLDVVVPKNVTAQAVFKSDSEDRQLLIFKHN